MKKVYKGIDERMTGSSKDNLIEFAKSKGFSTYTEYIVISLKTKTSREVVKEIKKSGINIIPDIWGTRNRVSVFSHRDTTKKGPCTNKCGRKIAEGNWRFCTKCQEKNNRIDIDHDINIFMADSGRRTKNGTKNI